MEAEPKLKVTKPNLVGDDVIDNLFTSPWTCLLQTGSGSTRYWNKFSMAINNQKEYLQLCKKSSFT
jgi:hypothetical protein